MGDFSALIKTFFEVVKIIFEVNYLIWDKKKLIGREYKLIYLWIFKKSYPNINDTLVFYFALNDIFFRV